MASVTVGARTVAMCVCLSVLISCVLARPKAELATVRTLNVTRNATLNARSSVLGFESETANMRQRNVAEVKGNEIDSTVAVAQLSATVPNLGPHTNSSPQNDFLDQHDHGGHSRDASHHEFVSELENDTDARAVNDSTLHSENEPQRGGESLPQTDFQEGFEQHSHTSDGPHTGVTPGFEHDAHPRAGYLDSSARTTALDTQPPTQEEQLITTCASAEEDGETDEAPDLCDPSVTPCSPFFGSPCNQLSKIPEELYVGKCAISEEEAEKAWTPCGGVTVSNRSACFCFNNSASCCGNLTSIPDLSINNSHPVYYLNFTSNNLSTLDRRTLQNVTSLRWLLLNRNNISVVTNDSLADMTCLQRFELALNNYKQNIDPYNFTAAVNSLSGTLQVLDVNYTEFSRARPRETGTTWVIRHLRLDNLKRLFVGGGRKKLFYLSDVVHLASLCHLSLVSHRIERVYCCSKYSVDDSLEYLDDETDFGDDDVNGIPDTYPKAIEAFTCVSPESRNDSFCQNFTLPNLKVFSLANNSVVHFPSFCSSDEKGEKVAVVPNLTHLSLAINALLNPRKYHFRCLDNLLQLALTGNPLKYIEPKVFWYMKSLVEVDLRFTNVMVAKKCAFAHPTLRRFSIKSSNWFMDDRHFPCCIEADIFQGTNLSWVELSYNNFRVTSRKKTERLLTPLKTVKTLLMAEIGLVQIPSVVQREFSQLEELDFQSNMVSTIHPDTFDNMTSLRHLDLRYNDLAVLDVGFLENLILSRNVQVDLQENPYSCTCDMLSFLDFYKAHRGTEPCDTAIQNGSCWKGGFIGENYHCFSPKAFSKKLLEHVDLTIHNCLLTQPQEIIICTFCVLTILAILVYAMLYKYRWQVRFWLYTVHVRLTRQPRAVGAQQGQPACPTRYRAFVSYCKEDSHFVLTKVLPALENSRRLPLCIHERDFIPGSYFTQNVVERMEESCHVLLVLSNAFLQNEWCRFELFVAMKYGLIHRQIPVTTLLLESPRADLMDGHVITLLQARPGIPWPGNRCSRRTVDDFWRRLAETLAARERQR